MSLASSLVSSTPLPMPMTLPEERQNQVIAKMRDLPCLFYTELQNFGYALTWYENLVPQLRKYVTL